MLLDIFSLDECSDCGRLFAGSDHASDKGNQMAERKFVEVPRTPMLPHFQTDGCIIQEQDDHLVLAIRIPKATIGANLHLFAALADYCVPSGRTS
jgi:hypothetical protein